MSCCMCLVTLGEFLLLEYVCPKFESMYVLSLEEFLLLDVSCNFGRFFFLRLRCVVPQLVSLDRRRTSSLGKN